MSCPITGSVDATTPVVLGAVDSTSPVVVSGTAPVPIGPLPGLDATCGEDIILVGDLIYVGDAIDVMEG